MQHPRKRGSAAPNMSHVQPGLSDQQLLFALPCHTGTFEPTITSLEPANDAQSMPIDPHDPFTAGMQAWPPSPHPELSLDLGNLTDGLSQQYALSCLPRDDSGYAPDSRPVSRTCSIKALEAMAGLSGSPAEVVTLGELMKDDLSVDIQL